MKNTKSKKIIALEESIEKYNRGAKGEVIGTGWGDCALCKLYFIGSTGTGNCQDCPIEAYTGERACKETPFTKLSKHLAGSLIHQTHENCPECMKLCTEERNFLEMLLAKEYENKKEVRTLYVGSTLKCKEHEGEGLVVKMENGWIHIQNFCEGFGQRIKLYSSLGAVYSIYDWLSDPKIKEGSMWKSNTDNQIYMVDEVKENEAYSGGVSIRLKDNYYSLSIEVFLHSYTLLLEEEKTYGIGDRFETDFDPDIKTCIMCHSDIGSVSLIGLEHGFRINVPVKVSDPRKITPQEFYKITKEMPHLFKRISKGFDTDG